MPHGVGRAISCMRSSCELMRNTVMVTRLIFVSPAGMMVNVASNAWDTGPPWRVLNKWKTWTVMTVRLNKKILIYMESHLKTPRDSVDPLLPQICRMSRSFSASVCIWKCFNTLSTLIWIINVLHRTLDATWCWQGCQVSYFSTFRVMFACLQHIQQTSYARPTYSIKYCVRL